MGGKYKAYPEYKDSGVEWLGEIPRDWQRLKFKFVAKAGKVFASGPFGSSIGSQFYQDTGVPVIRGNNLSLNGNKPKYIDDGYVYLTESKADDLSNAEVIPGDLVFTARGTVGQVGLVPDESITWKRAILSANQLRYRNRNERINTSYIWYLFSSWLVRTQILLSSDSVAQPNLNLGSLKDLNLLCPTIAEQVQIANFLDHETAKIDTLIEEQQSLIRLLKEKRQAVISHVVCPRSDENVARLAYFVDLLPGYAFSSQGYKSTEENNIKLLRGINIGVDSLKWDDVAYWPCSELADLHAFQLEKGDIVFGMDRPWISTGARVAEIEEKDLPCLLLQRVARIRSGKEAHQPFVKMCLQSFEFKNYVESDLTGVSVPHISPEQIKSFKIRDIGFDQQKYETDKALSQIEQIEQIIIEADDAIALMQERRTALISAAVTGKIDVRDWVAPEQKQKATV